MCIRDRGREMVSAAEPIEIPADVCPESPEGDCCKLPAGSEPAEMCIRDRLILVQDYLAWLMLS